MIWAIVFTRVAIWYFFQTENTILGKILEGLVIKDVGIFYGHLVHFVVIWYVFSRFGMLDQ
jgi:hypothetical protein